MGALSSTSSSFGNAAASTRLDNHDQANGIFIDDSLKQQVLAEEEAAMNQYKVIYRRFVLTCDRWQLKVTGGVFGTLLRELNWCCDFDVLFIFILFLNYFYLLRFFFK